ncbi:autotransporter domain-containing protein [Woodsholea maritima]|uniref:autotransporter domain-containing protein n=1 Tax=Woodsholea maritima TaxID=240237 RepID=UPI0003672B31|nr:autotransporter domain-containing protein [Woodsholea maritima]
MKNWQTRRASVRALLTATSALALTLSLSQGAQALPVNDDLGVDNAVDVNNVWSGVGMMYRASGFVCTGQLINPRTVIFAAHCVNSDPDSHFGAEFGNEGVAFSFGVNALPGFQGWFQRGFTSSYADNTFNVLQVQTPWGQSVGFPGGDIAIASFDVPTINLPTYAMLFSPITESTHATVIGYGTTGTGSQGANLGIDWKRRVGENMVDGLFSQNDFISGAAGAAGYDFGGPESAQLLYHIDFDKPGRDPDACGDIEYNNRIYYVCDDWQSGGVDFPTRSIRAGQSINWYGGDALPNEAGTAGGDSGSALFADQLASNPLILGVLSGGWVSGFFSEADGYGSTSYYQPLFSYWEWINAQNPYVYVSANAGDANWSDAEHWQRALDPHAMIIDANGNVVNGLPDEAGDPTTGLTRDTPKWGDVLGVDVNDQLGYEGPEAGGTQAVSASSLVGNKLGQVDASLITGGAEPVTIGTQSHPTPGQASTTHTEYRKITLADLGLQAFPSSFVPNNSYGTYGSYTGQAGEVARFYDVTLGASGTTTVDMNVEVDRLRIADLGAHFVLPEAYTFNSLIATEQTAGFATIDGHMNAREYMLLAGMLNGSGTLNTTTLFNVAGLVNPGGLGQVGTLTLWGDYVQASKAALVLDWSAQSGDLLSVDGDVSLSGDVIVMPTEGFVPRFGDRRRGVVYTGELVSDYSQLDGLPGALYLSAIEGAGFVDFEVMATRFSEVTSFNTWGQGITAGALDDARDASYTQMADLFAAIDLLEGDDLRNAVSNIAPQEHFHSTRSASSNAGVLINALGSQVLNFSQGQGAGASMNEARAGAGVMSLMGASALSAVSTATAAQTGMDGNGHRFALSENLTAFIAGGGINGDIRTSREVGRGDLSGGYGLLGLESRVHEHWVVGGALGMADTNTKQLLPGGGSITSTMQTKQAMGYVRYQNGSLFGYANASYGAHDGDNTKIAAVGGARFMTQADVEGDTYGAGLGAGYRFSSSQNHWHFTPLGSLQYAKSSFDNYSEAGSSVAQTLVSEDDKSLVARLGFEIRTQWDIAGAHFEPSVYWGGARDMSADGGNVDTAFNANASNVVTYYTQLDEARSWSEFGVSLSARFSDTFTMAVTYEDQVASKDQPVQRDSLSLIIRKGF